MQALALSRGLSVASKKLMLQNSGLIQQRIRFKSKAARLAELQCESNGIFKALPKPQ
jgi:hypothetical protein